MRPAILVQQALVAGDAEGFPLYFGPVNVGGCARGGGVLGDVHLVQQFVADALRNLLSPGHHGVLPGDGVFSHFRVLVVVSFPQNLVVHGMVQQVQSALLQGHELVVVLGQESYREVGGRDVHAVGLGAVHVGQGLLHVGHGVRVVQLLSQLDHAVLERWIRVVPGVDLRQVRMVARYQRANREKAEKQSFHNASFFCKAQKSYRCNEK